MILEADWVVPVSGPPVARGAVLVIDGVIRAVGPAAELRAGFPESPVRAFCGSALLPGLVNTHTHLDYSAFRGFAPACGFGEWMLRLLLARRKLDSADFGVSALWGAYECVRGGVTSIADTSFEGWTAARAAGSAGLRARVHLEVVGLDDAELPTTMTWLETRLAALERECGRPRSGAASGAGSLVEPGLSPHAPYTVSSRLYREVARFARRSGLRLVTHLAESRAEVELLARGTGAIAHAYRAARMWKGRGWTPPGLSPVQYVSGARALGPDTLAVHCVQIDAGDIAVLAAGGAAVAHCPRSNLRLQCGSAPVADLVTAGVTVGLGTDSLGSNDSLDMFAEMRAALAVGRARALSGAAAPGAGRGGVPGRPDARPLTPAAVLRMATLEGARALGWDHLVGSLQAGKRADVIAVRVPGLSWGREGGPGGLDPVETLVSLACADDVCMVMVNGRAIFDRPLSPDLQPLQQGGVPQGDYTACREAFAAVRAKLGLSD